MNELYKLEHNMCMTKPITLNELQNRIRGLIDEWMGIGNTPDYYNTRIEHAPNKGYEL